MPTRLRQCVEAVFFGCLFTLASLSNTCEVKIGLGIAAGIAGVVLIADLVISRRGRSQRSSGMAMLDGDLRHLAERTSADLFEFLQDRASSEPSYPDFGEAKAWADKQRDLYRHSQETMTRYDRKFGAQVLRAFDGFAEREMVDSLDRHQFEHPTNPLGIREVAQQLGVLAGRLSENHHGV
jgi:hypothetical protein